METPIACTLPGADMAARLADIESIGAAALLSCDHAEREAVLRFSSGPGICDRLAAVVAAEAQCCAFMTLDLREVGSVFVLTGRVPSGGEPALAQLVGSFRRLRELSDNA